MSAIPATLRALEVSAENLKRHGRLMELDPGYCDVIVDRWERHTGLQAVKLDAGV